MKPISKIILTIALPVLMLGTTSCLDDEPLIDWSVIEPVIELADSDHAQYANNMERGDVAEFMIIVNYTASYASDVKENIEVQLEVDLDTIPKINASLAASEVPFEAFPAASYENLRLNATIPAGTIAGASDGYIISGNFDHLELEINMAEPEVGLNVLPAGEDDETPGIRNDVVPGDEVIFDVELGISYPQTIGDETVVAGLSIDPLRIAILNASMDESETPYQLLSSDEIATYFTLTPGIAVVPYDPETEEGGTVESTELSIAPGTMKTAIKIKANTDVMQPGMRYVLPLQIDYVSDYFAPGSGNLIYLEVNMAE